MISQRRGLTAADVTGILDIGEKARTRHFLHVQHKKEHNTQRSHARKVWIHQEYFTKQQRHLRKLKIRSV